MDSLDTALNRLRNIETRRKRMYAKRNYKNGRVSKGRGG